LPRSPASSSDLHGPAGVPAGPLTMIPMSRIQHTFKRLAGKGARRSFPSSPPVTLPRADPAADAGAGGRRCRHHRARRPVLRPDG
jgi:hypothetical protein